MKIKKDDIVLIISGKYRGKTGKILKSFPKKNQILVEGINLRKKHQKPKKSGEKGQIIEILVPLNVSNAQLICPKCKKAVRIGYRIEGGKKYRICKKCDKALV
ncbi:MAG: 50S ribosomal protein L24 [Patescibacteria group bacterium]|nr:50S ribosomal protein L24 [Patescibacteria group bacterium]MBU1876959.1 50S ribosomal protein L24 [Patescibacteria group bacterium]